MLGALINWIIYSIVYRSWETGELRKRRIYLSKSDMILITRERNKSALQTIRVANRPVPPARAVSN